MSDPVGTRSFERSRRWLSEYGGVLVVFAVLLAAKLLYVTQDAYGPVIFGDEALYARYARSMYQSLRYTGTHYPLLYPLAIAPAFFLGDRFFSGILFLNSVYSSLAVVPAYLIARMTLSRRDSLACAAAVGVIPLHFVMTRSVMSENLFLPLLLLAAWLVLRPNERRPLMWDLATAFALGALYLTRHISLSLIPAFYLVWWLRPLGDEKPAPLWRPGRAKLARLAAMLAVTAGTYGVWIAMQTRNGAPLKRIFGLGIAAASDPRQLTLAALGVWIVIYVTYFVLTAAPVLGLIVMSALEALRAKALDVFGRTVALVGVLNVALLVAMVRHSWRAPYNYPTPDKIMGRYAACFAAMYVILAFVSLPRVRNWFDRGSRVAVVAGLLAPALVLVAAWAGLVESPWSRLLTDRGSVDVYRMALLGRPLLFLALGVMAVTALALWRTPSRAALVLAGGLAVFYLWGTGAYHERLMLHQVYALHGREIAAAAATVTPNVRTRVGVSVEGDVLTEPYVTPRRLAQSTNFWFQGKFGYADGPPVLLSRGSVESMPVTRLVLRRGHVSGAIVTYIAGGDTYSIVRVR